MRGTRRVVVVGDVLLDRDLLGRTERLCPDAPVPVVDLVGERESPGGAGLAAWLCASGDVSVTLVAPFGTDPPGRTLATALSRHVEVLALPQDGPTRTKTRVRCGDQSLLRLDDGGPARPVEVPLDAVRAALASADVVLVSDYGAGTTGHQGIRRLLAGRGSRVPLVWDPHPRGAAPVAGATLVTPNLAEAGAMAGGGSGASTGTGGPPERLADMLRRRWRAKAVCVTAGSAGGFLSMATGEPLYVPAPAVRGGDPCGAGDRFAASAAVALARGALTSEAVLDAVQEASAWVAAGGSAAFRSAFAPAGTDGRPDAAPPAGEPETVEQVSRRVRAAGGRLVATGGCFDVLHAGHVSCLDAARRLGDALVVLINSDASVRRGKGPGRPAVPAADRARVLAALGCVDAVAVFDEDDPGAALERLRPDVWVKGGDYGGAVLPEAAVVRRHGGRVVLLPYLDGRSSSRILVHSQEVS